MDTMMCKCQKCGVKFPSYEPHECNLNTMIGYGRAKEDVYEILERMVNHKLIEHDIYALVVGELGPVERLRDEERQF